MKKQLFLINGWFFLIVGIIGIFIPLLPTTPFVLLAAFFFQKGSDKMYQKIRNNKFLGPALIDWENNQIIRPKAKLIASLLIITSLSYPLFFKPIPIALKVVAAAIGLSLVLFINTRNSS